MARRSKRQIPAPHLALVIVGREVAAGQSHPAEFATELKDAVRLSGLGHVDLACEAEMPVTRLYQLETGRVEPTPEEVERIAVAVNWRYWSERAAKAAARKRASQRPQ